MKAFFVASFPSLSFMCVLKWTTSTGRLERFRATAFPEPEFSWFACTAATIGQSRWTATRHDVINAPSTRTLLPPLSTRCAVTHLVFTSYSGDRFINRTSRFSKNRQLDYLALIKQFLLQKNESILRRLQNKALNQFKHFIFTDDFAWCGDLGGVYKNTQPKPRIFRDDSAGMDTTGPVN